MIPRSFGTHDGSFHADEVTACSLLLVFGLIDKDKIVRSRDPARLALCDYVCDVGGIYDPKKRRFDHHQVDYQGPLSSAGMILLYLKEEGVIDSHLYELFNNLLILGVDAHDNGRGSLEAGVTTFSHVVSNFVPIEYEASKEELDEAFFAALQFVVGHLDRMHRRFLYSQQCGGLVRKVMAESQNVLIFDRPIPWMDIFFELEGELHPAQFVIMPAGGHWKLRGIPPNRNERMKVRKQLPEEWAGLHEEALYQVSGILGAVFCHKGRFISIWETKEAAVQALNRAMEK
ncbi:MAG TPA: MYG1 family protein [Chlamydiales bacterium]|nr:MYG1 family protein [Chlamydiales bacterium]